MSVERMVAGYQRCPPLGGRDPIRVQAVRDRVQVHTTTSNYASTQVNERRDIVTAAESVF
jgi:hypothetical protein